jgi:hypothetical protein
MNEATRRLLDAVQNAAWIAAVARVGQKIKSIDYYNYNVGPNQGLSAIAVAGTGQATIQIQADSDFAIAYMSGSAVVSGAVVTNPVATIQLTDTGTGKTFFSSPTLFSLVMGQGGLPFYLPAPRVVAPNTNLQVNISYLAGAAAADFYVNLLGARIYY